MRTPIKVIILAAFALLMSGCVTQNAAAQFAEFEKLGIVEAQITGKFSNTEYRVVHDGNKRRAVFSHSNAWIPKILIIRETEEKAP